MATAVRLCDRATPRPDCLTTRPIPGHDQGHRQWKCRAHRRHGHAQTNTTKNQHTEISRNPQSDKARWIRAELLPAVLPLLIDVQRVRLDRRDRELLIPLRQATNGIEGMAVSPRVLYNRLDAVTQDELNYDDFAAFCTRLVEAGELDDAGLDDVRPRSAGAPAWIRITWT